jgi:hypothetical protein
MTGFPAASGQAPGAEGPAMPGFTGNQSLPPEPAAHTTPKPFRRRRWWIVGVVVVLMVGAGATWWLWPSGTHVVPGTVQASVVSADDASMALGQTLQSQHGISEPPPALPADPANCAVAVGPTTQAVYANGWTTFGSVTYQDSDSEANHTVTQVIGLYSTSDEARQVFGTLSDGMKNCTSAVRAGGGGGQRASKWFYAATKNTADTVSWQATQDAGDGWACYRQARLKGRAVLQVAVCEAGDGSQPAATIADQFATRVSG